MNESHIIQICTRLLQKYLLWPHILLSFEYSELLLRSERITWTCASLSYCCHVEPALKESQGRCLPKVNYLLGLGANYILEIAENTGNLSEEKLKRQFLVLKDVYKNSHSSLACSSFKMKTPFYFLPCVSLPLDTFPLAKCRSRENGEGWKKIFITTRKFQIKQIISSSFLLRKVIFLDRIVWNQYLPAILIFKPYTGVPDACVLVGVDTWIGLNGDVNQILPLPIWQLRLPSNEWMHSVLKCNIFLHCHSAQVSSLCTRALTVLRTVWAPKTSMVAAPRSAQS